MASFSSTDSWKRQRALNSRGLFGDPMGQILSIPSNTPSDVLDQNVDDPNRHYGNSVRASCHKKRSRSRSPKSASRSKSRSPRHKQVHPEPDRPSANVCIVKKSGVGKIRSWMKHGIESKQEGVTLRSSMNNRSETFNGLVSPTLTSLIFINIFFFFDFRKRN